VASLALGVVWLLSGGGWPTRAAWPGILGSGLLWFGLYMVTLQPSQLKRRPSSAPTAPSTRWSGTCRQTGFVREFRPQLFVSFDRAWWLDR